MMEGEYRWSAFDPNQWDHYHHAGQQVRFYRQCPAHLTGAGFETIEPRWIDSLMRFLERIKL